MQMFPCIIMRLIKFGLLLHSQGYLMSEKHSLADYPEAEENRFNIFPPEESLKSLFRYYCSKPPPTDSRYECKSSNLQSVDHLHMT